MALIGRPDVWEIFTLEPGAIIVPDDYGRTDVGDLTELAASIDKFGLLAPILVHIDDEGQYVLRSGLRRLRACTEILGWKVVPLLAVDHLHETSGDAAMAFRDDNGLRKALTPSEAVKVADIIEDRVRVRLAERKRAGVKMEPSGNLPEGSPLESREVAAAAVGLSATTLRSARRLLHMVDRPDLDPQVREQVRQKVEFMDSTGNVSRALREARALVEPQGADSGGVTEPSLRQAWARAGAATESFIKALDVTAQALSREVPGLGSEIADTDLDTVEAGALRALELVRQVRKSRLQVVVGG